MYNYLDVSVIPMCPLSGSFTVLRNTFSFRSGLTDDKHYVRLLTVRRILEAKVLKAVGSNTMEIVP